MPSSSKSEDTEVDAHDRYVYRFCLQLYRRLSDRISSNAQNDALLHRLVHTELLSGSSNPEFSWSAANRRKALAGRILELSGDARLGKGHKAVIEKERNKAAKRVRDGLIEKRRARATQELEEVGVLLVLNQLVFKLSSRLRIRAIIILQSRSCLNPQLIPPVEKEIEV